MQGPRLAGMWVCVRRGTGVKRVHGCEKGQEAQCGSQQAARGLATQMPRDSLQITKNISVISRSGSLTPILTRGFSNNKESGAPG